jgi:hypothetical protein
VIWPARTCPADAVPDGAVEVGAWNQTATRTRVFMGSVIKKRRKRMAKKKHRKLLRKTRHQRRNKK